MGQIVQVGGVLLGGTANEVLFVDSAGKLAQHSNLRWDGTILELGADTYLEVTGATGSGSNFRFGSDTTGDGLACVYTITGGVKQLQYGSTQLNLMGNYHLVGYQQNQPLGTGPTSGTKKFELIPASGNAVFEGTLSCTGNANLHGTDVIISTSPTIELTVPSSTIYFTGTSGGMGGIQYKDTGGSARYGLLWPGSNLVALCNRAANGVVQIRANTATSGIPGEVVIATFEDTHVTVAGSLRIDGDNGGAAGMNTFTDQTDTPTSPYNWNGTGTAPDGYVKAYVGTQAVVIPFWNT